ncbi:MAG: nitroreductase [Desulfobacterales bacterium]|nr:nitroreductase [Desulfobacterales bacterium]
MDLFKCIEGRKSCRAFLGKKVDKGILEKVLKAANRSPSYRNTQPWEVFVVAGEKKEALARKLSDAAASGVAATPGLPAPQAWPEAFAKRMREHNLARLKAIGIDPENEKQIRDNYSRNYKFYDAPCVIFVGMDKSLTSWSVFDLGCFAQSILLGLEAEGLGGVIQASVTNYGDIIRKEVGAPETMAILISISVGHPDLEAPVNSYRSRRKESGEFVRWVGL